MTMHINFLDKNNKTIFDSLDNQFMVRGMYRKIKKELTYDEIKEIVNSNSLKCNFYLYSLYDDETIKEDLSNYIMSGGSLMINYNNGLRRRLNISLLNEKKWVPTPYDGFLWKGSKFKFEIGFKTTFAEFICPAGVFVLKDYGMGHSSKNNELKLEMVDKFGGLDGTVGGKIVEDVYIPRGSNIIQVVNSLLKSAKNDGMVYDNIVPLFPLWAYTEKTPYTITESSNSTIGSLIIKLMSLLNLDVFYDEYGRLRTEEMSDNILINTSPSIWNFNNNDSLYSPHTTQINLQSVENIVVVEGANINGNIVNVKVENTNAKSPTNIYVFEPTYVKIIDENIYDEGQAYLRANYELFKRSLLPISEQFKTILMPHLDVNKVVTINDDTCGLKNTKFLINSINISIAETPVMDMTINNLEEVAFSGQISI